MSPKIRECALVIRAALDMTSRSRRLMPRVEDVQATVVDDKQPDHQKKANRHTDQKTEQDNGDEDQHDDGKVLRNIDLHRPRATSKGTPILAKRGRRPSELSAGRRIWMCRGQAATYEAGEHNGDRLRLSAPTTARRNTPSEGYPSFLRKPRTEVRGAVQAKFLVKVQVLVQLGLETGNADRGSTTAINTIAPTLPICPE